MPNLAARLAVSAAAASVVLTGIEAIRLRRPRGLAQPQAPVAAASEMPDAVPRLDLRPQPPFGATPDPKPRPLGTIAMARIHGRVVGPGALDDLNIEVEATARAYQPRIEDDGRFQINLPPGSYAVIARAGDLVAFAEAPGLVEAEDRELVLVLDKGVSITGQVDGCHGPCAGADVAVSGPGARHEESIETDQHGEFSIDRLIPGRVYDLDFRLRGKRHLVMNAITAPRKGLGATLEDAVVLSGGFGVAPGAKCPMRTIELEAATGDLEITRNNPFDRACRFRFDGLADVALVHLTADGEGWHFEVDVPLPEHGDPPFLCLRPPCREPEPDVPADLEVRIDSETDGPVHVRAALPDDERARTLGCQSRAKPCVLENLRAGQDVKVEVHARSCEARSYQIALHAGRNLLTFTCARRRPISGIVRGENADDGAWVRCSADAPVQPTGRTFFLECSDRLETIEYQLVENGPWQTAAVSPEADGGGWVEITAE